MSKLNLNCKMNWKLKKIYVKNKWKFWKCLDCTDSTIKYMKKLKKGNNKK
jgi:hypothetical protein